MDCFERVGMKVPSKRGGYCPCGERVDFHVVMRRLDHFMVCPVVDRRLKKMTATLKFDAEAVELGRQLLESLS